MHYDFWPRAAGHKERTAHNPLKKCLQFFFQYRFQQAQSRWSSCLAADSQIAGTKKAPTRGAFFNSWQKPIGLLSLTLLE
jgi:hypothetical protein